MRSSQFSTARLATQQGVEFIDQRTCGSYSLPCFSFSAPVRRGHGDVVGGHGLQPLQDGAGGVAGHLERHLTPAGDLRGVRQAVVEDPPRRRQPRHPHGALRLVRHRQLLGRSGG